MGAAGAGIGIDGKAKAGPAFFVGYEIIEVCHYGVAVDKALPLTGEGFKDDPLFFLLCFPVPQWARVYQSYSMAVLQSRKATMLDRYFYTDCFRSSFSRLSVDRLKTSDKRRTTRRVGSLRACSR